MIPLQSNTDPYDLVDIRYYNLILKWQYSASLTLLEVLKKLLVGTIRLYIWMGMNLYTFLSTKTKINFAANSIYVMVDSLYLNNNL